MSAHRKSNGHGIVYCKFYFRDWMSEPSLRRLEPAHRGLWIDMICLMAQGENYGHLESNGKPWPDEELSKCVGVACVLLKQMLEQMERVGVFSRDKRGVIFCRRMVRDMDIYTKRAAAGAIGGRASKGAAAEDEEKEEAISRIQNPESTKGSSTCSSTCSSKTWELADFTTAAQPIGMKPEDVEECFHHYASVGFIDAAGRKITSVPSLLAKWKANQHSRGKETQRESRKDREQREKDEIVRNSGL